LKSARGGRNMWRTTRPEGFPLRGGEDFTCAGKTKPRKKGGGNPRPRLKISTFFRRKGADSGLGTRVLEIHQEKVRGRCHRMFSGKVFRNILKKGGGGVDLFPKERQGKKGEYSLEQEHVSRGERRVRREGVIISQRHQGI